MRHLGPAHLVAVGGPLFGAAPHLLYRFGALLLQPLVHLHLAAKLDGGLRNGLELRVGKDLVGRSQGGNMDELLFLRGIHLVGRDGNDRLARLLEPLGGADCPPLVPTTAERKR